jgi:hypothetical protein
VVYGGKIGTQQIYKISSVPWDQEIYFSKNNRLRLFPTLENTSLTLNQGIGVCVLKRKSKIFEISPSKSYFWG